MSEDNRPKLVTLEPHNAIKAAGEALARSLPEMISAIETVAKYRRASYLAHLAAGFTDAQALELCHW